MGTEAYKYDAFLSHSSADKALVESLAGKLLEAGLIVFFDSSVLEPGRRWLEELERGILASRSFLLCVGSSGLSPWAEQEANVALSQRVRDSKFSFIPVLLPGASREQLGDISLFAQQYHAIDLRHGFEGKEFGNLLEALATSDSPASARRRPLRGLLPEHVEAEVVRLQRRFSDSLRHHLAGGQLIRRRETQDLLAVISEDSARVVVVHGEAGSGKSGVLFEMTQELDEQGLPFLPIRLDRYELRGSPRVFGEQMLGLPASPANCLAVMAGGKEGVLLLDQLDALRWTSAHSSEAWDVCREVISEALTVSPGLKVVVCCRTFDLEHDPQLRGWEQETKNLRRLEVKGLSDEEVQEAIARISEGRENRPVLSPREQALLRRILHLQMWLAIYVKSDPAPTFSTAWKLMEAFWATRLDELSRDGIAPARAEELESRLVEAVHFGAVLRAPVRSLRMLDSELKLYQDYHLIQVEGEVFTFCHQTYQDYLVARHLLRQLDRAKPDSAGREVISWLGPREGQSLFRREQLRLVLLALRAEDHRGYIAVLKDLLAEPLGEEDKRVRFHIRLLAIQFLGQVLDPKREEVELVLALLEQASWREHVLEETVMKRPSWFLELDRRGKVQEWLASTDSGTQDSAVRLLLSVAENCGDSVARLLVPFLEQGEVWINRILWILNLDPSQDSDALFEIRLRLAKQGLYIGEYVDWPKLAQHHPERFILLVAHLLLALVSAKSRGEERRRPGRRGEIDWHQLEKVNSGVLPVSYWNSAWRWIFQSLALVAKLRAYPGESSLVVESYAISFDTLRPVLRLLKELGRALLAEDWSRFVSLGEEISQEGPAGEAIFLDALVEGPVIPEFADWLVAWLQADPRRVRLRIRRGSGQWSLAAQIIERFSDACSQGTYQRLEQWLISYVEPDLVERYRRRHEWMGVKLDLSVSSPFGETAHALLRKLPVSRRSLSAMIRIGELDRKFNHPLRPETVDDDDVKVGWVGSPLSDAARSRMSDEDWIAIATNEQLPARWGKVRIKPGQHIEEASIETFSREFRTMAQRQPERFARIGLRLPPTVDSEFLTSILSGVSSPEDRRPPQNSAEWMPPHHETLERLLALPTVEVLARKGGSYAGQQVCWLIERYSDYPWSGHALGLLEWIALNHGDPQDQVYPVSSSAPDSDAFDSLETNALNVTRGAAGVAVRSLLFKQPSLFVGLKSVLDHLVRDSHPAVRTASVSACLPVLNIDRDLAVELFLVAVSSHDAILATNWARTFLRFAYRTHLEQLKPLLKRMVDSAEGRVAIAGAAQVAACFLIDGELKEVFDSLLQGTSNQRRGVAQVAAELLGEGDFYQDAKKVLLRLANDEDEEVARTVASGFENLELRHVTSDRDAWNLFARSKAFQADPSPLLHSLERQSGDLMPFADCLLTAGTTFAEELAEVSRDMATRFSGDARLILPLLLRLYEQAREQDQALYLRCLDLWDLLLQRRVGAAMGLTQELDRM